MVYKKSIHAVLVLLLLQVGACGVDSCYDYNFINITDYDFKETGKTLLGISVSDYSGELNLDLIDEKVLELESCLGISIDYGCINVLVPPDTYISPCSDQELFPCTINPQLCLDKGITPTEECLCACRGAIQNNSIIVTVSSLVTFKGELTRLITGVNNPWTNENTKLCM
jgi:hypothetical protein